MAYGNLKMTTWGWLQLAIGGPNAAGVQVDNYFNITDNNFLTLGDGQDFQISYDEAVDDRLEISDGNNQFLTIKDQGTAC